MSKKGVAKKAQQGVQQQEKCDKSWNQSQ